MYIYIAGFNSDGTLRIAKILQKENRQELNEYIENELGFEDREEILDINIFEGTNIVGRINAEDLFNYVLKE